MAEKLIAMRGTEVIGTYDDIAEAANDTLLDTNDIRHSIATKTEIDGFTFFWHTYNKRSQKKVNQLDSEGHIIATYANAHEAFTKTGICNIYKALCKKINSAGGFIWEYADKPSYKPMKVVLISDTGEFVKLFRSIDELSNYINVDTQEALCIARGIQETEHGYFINISNISSHVIEFKRGHISNIYLRQAYAGKSLGVKPQRIYGACIRGTEINGKVFRKLEDIINKKL